LPLLAQDTDGIAGAIDEGLTKPSCIRPPASGSAFLPGRAECRPGQSGLEFGWDRFVHRRSAGRGGYDRDHDRLGDDGMQPWITRSTAE
jgi:hypothetical protein